MHELDETNAADYLVNSGRLAEPVAVRELSGGVSNIVLWIDVPGRPFVLKQSRGQLRTVDPWFCDVDRIFREAQAMCALRPVLGDVVPEILFEDSQNYLFAMSAAPADSVVWKRQLLAGEADGEICRRWSMMLATMHQRGSRNPDWQSQFGDQQVFHDLRLEPYYYRIRGRAPEVASHIDDLIAETTSIRASLVHGDFSPKNMLVGDDSLTLVDYETVHYGDPAFDIGFFLAHLHLKTIFHAGRHEPFAGLLSTFWETYLNEITFEPEQSLVPRALRHLAANMLVRIDGTSPVDYLDDEAKREAGRDFARDLLRQPIDSWPAALQLLRRIVSDL